MSWRMRYTYPKPGPWLDVDGDSMTAAVNSQHLRDYPALSPGVSYRNPLPSGGHETVHFAPVEVEGFGELVSRVFWVGISRRGGVPRPGAWRTLGQVAEMIGWTHPPDELLGEWVGEETWEEAEDR